MGGAVILPNKEEFVPVSTGMDDIDALQLPFHPFDPASYAVDGAARLALIQEKAPTVYYFWRNMGMDKYVLVVEEATVKRGAQVENAKLEEVSSSVPNEPIPLSTTDKSHLDVMTDHLLSLPMGAASQKKVKLIRLINKSKLFALPDILTFVKRIHQVIEGVRIELRTETPYMMGGSGQYISLSGKLTAEAVEVLQEIVREPTSLREHFESLLFWRENQNDDIFELFDTSISCPRFTFISHRWAAGGKALGEHNELLAMLAFAPEEYIWLDCSGAPQNQSSFENGNCLKIIWNIDMLLERATNILTYYASTGLHVSPVPQDDNGHPINVEDICELSDGILTLHQAYTASYRQVHQHYHNCIANRAVVAGNRLWCCLERTLGRDKIITVSNNGFPILHTYESIAKVKLEDMFNNAVVGMTDSTGVTRRENAFHARHCFSLDCYAVVDIEPVTTLLYKAGVLPAIFKDNTIYCHVMNDDVEEEVIGLLLPEPPYMTQTLLPKNKASIPKIAVEYPLDVSLPNCGCSHGWKYDLATENYYFRMVWPQNPTMPELSLQAHARCLAQSKTSIWKYSPMNPAQKIDYFYKFQLNRSPCVICCENGLYDEMWNS